MPALSVLPVETHPWSALLTRSDVVLDRGILHLRHDSVTAAQAEIEDLLLVASTLERAGIATTLIRHEGRAPAIVVDVAERDAAFTALRALGRQEPLYIKPRRGTAVLAVDVADAAEEPSSWRVFRPRVTRVGGLRYGASVGARLEFWRFGEIVEAPLSNALLRTETDPQDVVYTTVEK
ncbi:MAG TPA: sugar phosphotransferase, partial [Microbacterium sp.]|nr:sugar phosphotransferase [Microbacterium sp.]